MRSYNGERRDNLQDIFGGLPGLGLVSSTAKVSASRLKGFCVFTPRVGMLFSLFLDDILTVNIFSVCPVGKYNLQGTGRMFPCI